MSWSPIAPATKTRPGAGAAAVCVGMRAASTKFPAALVITLRGALLPQATFLAHPHASAMLGGGDHEGLLRIVPGREAPLYKPTGRVRAGTVLMRLAVPPGVTAVAKPPHPVQFLAGEDYIQIELPDWARRSGETSVQRGTRLAAEAAARARLNAGL